MALGDDLIADTDAIFARTIEVTQGRVIPAVADLPLGNQGRELQLVALFVDVRKSTRIVDAIGCEPAARMYKAFLRGVTRVIRDRGGDVLSFNGDGIASGFVGDSAANAAVLSAFNIAWFCDNVLGPKVNGLLAPVSDLRFDFGIGIDTGKVIVVRGGIRGEENSDLVWAGNPVNYSVKLSTLALFPWGIYVSKAIMDQVHHSLVFSDPDFRDLWDAWYWTEKQAVVWRSSWIMGPRHIPTVPA